MRLLSEKPLCLVAVLAAACSAPMDGNGPQGNTGVVFSVGANGSDGRYYELRDAYLVARNSATGAVGFEETLDASPEPTLQRPLPAGPYELWATSTTAPDVFQLWVDGVPEPATLDSDNPQPFDVHPFMVTPLKLRFELGEGGTVDMEPGGVDIGIEVSAPDAGLSIDAIIDGSPQGGDPVGADDETTGM